MTVVEPGQISAKVREITDKALANMNRLDVQDDLKDSEARGQAQIDEALKPEELKISEQ